MGLGFRVYTYVHTLGLEVVPIKGTLGPEYIPIGHMDTRSRDSDNRVAKVNGLQGFVALSCRGLQGFISVLGRLVPGLAI